MPTNGQTAVQDLCAPPPASKATQRRQWLHLGMADIETFHPVKVLQGRAQRPTSAHAGHLFRLQVGTQSLLGIGAGDFEPVSPGGQADLGGKADTALLAGERAHPVRRSSFHPPAARKLPPPAGNRAKYVPR